MRIDWLPFSAAALVLGATALSVGALILPSGDTAADTLQIASNDSGRWLAVAVLYFLAAVTLTLGMPSILTLFHSRGTKFGLTAIGVFTIGCIGLAGFSMMLAFFGALAKNHAIDPDLIDQVSSEPGLTAFLLGWIGAFYLGELLLAIALVRARDVPIWIPSALFLHVALLPISALLRFEDPPATALLITISLCGVGITANQNAARVPVPV